MEQVDSFVGGAMFIGLNLLVVLLPTLVALWLGVRAVRALERAARAQEATARQLANVTVLLEQAASTRAAGK